MAYVIIKTGGDGYNHGSAHKEYQISNISDVSGLPTDCAPGSLARPANRSFWMCLSNDNTWQEVVTTTTDIGTLIDESTTSIDWGAI